VLILKRRTGVLRRTPSREAALLDAHEKEDAARGMTDAMFFQKVVDLSAHHSRPLGEK
jgi:hypothetical protein